MFESLLPSLFAGAVTGLTTYGALRVEMRWLRRDLDVAQGRIERLENHVLHVSARFLDNLPPPAAPRA